MECNRSALGVVMIMEMYLRQVARHVVAPMTLQLAAVSTLLSCIFFILSLSFAQQIKAFDPARAELDAGSQGSANDCQLNSNNQVSMCSSAPGIYT